MPRTVGNARLSIARILRRKFPIGAMALDSHENHHADLLGNAHQIKKRPRRDCPHFGTNSQRFRRGTNGHQSSGRIEDVEKDH